MELRLSAPSLDFWVDVHLRRINGRWVAAAEIAGQRELGLGLNPRDALAASLSSLGPVASEALLADPSLLGVHELRNDRS